MLKFLPLTAAVGLMTLASCIQPVAAPPRDRRPPSSDPATTDPNNDQPGLVEPPPPGPIAPPTATGGYPTARKTDNPLEVKSPYEPYNIIDISGPPPFKSGQLARDPSNQKIFRVP